VTSTPRGLKFLRDLEKDPSTAKTHGTTYENQHNLAPSFLKKIRDKYEGTRLGRQEIGAEILDDNPGALWKQKSIDDKRLTVAEFAALGDVVNRIVVSLDPATTSNDDSDEHGIICVGAGMCCCNGKAALHGFVFEDGSDILTPNQACERVLQVYENRMCNTVVGETNQGGDWIEALLRAHDKAKCLPYHGVHAKDGKRLRADPVAALYEQCVAIGSCVETAHGGVPIELVKAGDMVWTRDGLRRVLWSGQTGVRDTVRVRTEVSDLVCTPDHPIFVRGRGFIHAEALVPRSDMLDSWPTYRRALTAQALSVSHGAAADRARLDIGGRLRAVQSASLSSSEKFVTTVRGMGIGGPGDTLGENCFIVPSGCQSVARSRMAGTSITSTVTQATTTCPTSLRSLRPSTLPSTLTTRRLLRRLESSMRAPGALSGGLSEIRWCESAISAERHSHPSPLELDSVVPLATHPIGIVSVQPGPRVPVFNLSVDGTPEFFASGILVHNCRVHHVGNFPKLEDEQVQWDPNVTLESPNRIDALVHGLTYLIVKPPPAQYEARTPGRGHQLRR
jgi:hypothetical protein